MVLIQYLLLTVFLRFLRINKTNTQIITESTITTDVEGLIQLLGCGRETAKAIGELAQARVKTNSRRTIYSIEKIKDYCLTHTY